MFSLHTSFFFYLSYIQDVPTSFGWEVRMKISTLCKINFMKFVFKIEVRSARIFFAFREILRVFAKDLSKTFWDTW